MRLQTESGRRLREARLRRNQGTRDRITTNTKSRGRNYFWITGIVDGKPFLFLGGANSEEARMKAFDMLPGVDFEIKALPTTNTAKASQLLKYGKLADTRDIRRARERLGHDKTIKRRQAKQAGWGL